MAGNIGIEDSCALTYVSRFYPPHLTNCCVNTRLGHPAPKAQHDLLSSGGGEVWVATTPPDMEASGKPAQQNGFDSRYAFSAREKEDETPYLYFGARYGACPAESGNSDLSVWLSVDPMSDKYPSLSTKEIIQRFRNNTTEIVGRYNYTYDSKGKQNLSGNKVYQFIQGNHDYSNPVLVLG